MFQQSWPHYKMYLSCQCLIIFVVIPCCVLWHCFHIMMLIKNICPSPVGIERNQDSLEKWPILRLGQGKYEMSKYNIFFPESKEGLSKLGHV